MDLISTFENTSNETNYFVYRTEVYLQQREKDSVDRTPPDTVTTWENLKNQKQIFDDDQAEIDRVLSTIDSIHGTFNRSLLIPYNQVYSSLYGDDENDDSVDLMKMFCQRRDHCSHFDDENLDIDTDDEDEKENEKTYSYDSGYRSFIPKRQSPREPFVKLTQPWSIKSNL